MTFLHRLGRTAIRSRMRLLASLAVLSLAAAVGAVLASGSKAGSGNDCGVGVPAFKCNPGGPLADPTNHPTNVPSPSPFWPSESLVSCGDGFFSADQQNALADQFGSLHCFRFDRRDTWVVVSDGMNTSGDGAAPGGSIIATEVCAGQARTTCLDPNSLHDFSAFTVSYAPDPSVWPMRLQATFGSRLIYVGAGACGPYAFDVQARRWFGGANSDIQAVLGGNGSARSVAAPGSTTGSVALTRPAPASAITCS